MSQDDSTQDDDRRVRPIAARSAPYLHANSATATHLLDDRVILYPADGQPAGAGGLGHDALADELTPQLQQTNGLLRTNYFNGRYMTAEALHRDQVYFERRDRLVAQTHTWGIAWGLGLRPPSTWHDEVDVGDEFVLQPGLAFDDEGRPISVQGELRFTFSSLLSDFTARPSMAVRGGTSFAPCVCMKSHRPDTTDAGAAHEVGPYLLVVYPTETSEGLAKVHDQSCGGTTPRHCKPEAWRQGVALSLVKYPFDPMQRHDVQTMRDARGAVAAHYFYEWEYNLAARWEDPFARDDRFCEGLGPLERGRTVVPLAMVYIGSGGGVSFVDPWTPRRYQVRTAGETWAARTLDAPPPSAVIARTHQFQCMLHDALHRPEDNVSVKPVHEPAEDDGERDPAREERRRELKQQLKSTEQQLLAAEEELNDLHDKARDIGRPLPDDLRDGIDNTEREVRELENQMADLEKELARLRADESTDSDSPPYVVMSMVAEDAMQRKSMKPQAAPPRAGENLYQMGFRRIPPYGFLPLDLDDGSLDDEFYGERWKAAGIDPLARTRFERQALARARHYFRGTNVLVVPKVAVYEDDIYEDMVRTREKDPVTLKPMGQTQWDCLVEFFNDSRSLNPESFLGMKPVAEEGPNRIWRLLKCLLRSEPVDLERIVRREIEVVELVVPMHGTDEFKPVGRLVGQKYRSDEKLAAPGARPRNWVFYVKKRITLLQPVYELLERVIFIVQLLTDRFTGAVGRASDVLRASLLPAHRRPKGVGFLNTRQFRAALQPPVLLGRLMRRPELVTMIAQHTRKNHPEMNKEDTLKLYQDKFREMLERNQIPADVEDPSLAEEVKNHAIANAIDEVLDEHAGFGVYKVLYALDPLLVSRLHQRLSTSAERRGEYTIGDRAFVEGVDLVAEERIRRLYAAARRAVSDRNVGEFAADVDVGDLSDASLEDVFRRTETELGERIGRNSAEKVRRLAVRRGRDLKRAVNEIGAAPQLSDERFWDKFDDAQRASVEPREALDKLVSTTEGSERQFAVRLRDVLRVVGPDGFYEVLQAIKEVR